MMYMLISDAAHIFHGRGEMSIVKSLNSKGDIMSVPTSWAAIPKNTPFRGLWEVDIISERSAVTIATVFAHSARVADEYAKLVAAAPELLEALKACHDVLLMDKKYSGGRAQKMAEKVLDKL